MKARSLKMRWRLLALLLILANGSAASASGLILNPPIALVRQASRSRQVTVPEAVIIEGEKAIAERDHLRVVVGMKDDEIAALKDQVGALNGLAQIQRERAESLLKAAQERSTALMIEDKRIALYETDTARLRAERDSARAGQKWFGFGGVVIGVALGYYGTRRK